MPPPVPCSTSKPYRGSARIGRAGSASGFLHISENQEPGRSLSFRQNQHNQEAELLGRYHGCTGSRNPFSLYQGSKPSWRHRCTYFEIKHPLPHELIAGPWESVSPSGIDGIFFNIETSSEGPVGHQQKVWQTLNIRVYHRQRGKETWGWAPSGIPKKSHNFRIARFLCKLSKGLSLRVYALAKGGEAF